MGCVWERASNTLNCTVLTDNVSKVCNTEACVQKHMYVYEHKYNPVSPKITVINVFPFFLTNYFFLVSLWRHLPLILISCSETPATHTHTHTHKLGFNLLVSTDFQLIPPRHSSSTSKLNMPKTRPNPFLLLCFLFLLIFSLSPHSTSKPQSPLQQFLLPHQAQPSNCPSRPFSCDSVISLISDLIFLTPPALVWA